MLSARTIKIFGTSYFASNAQAMQTVFPSMLSGHFIYILLFSKLMEHSLFS